MLGADRAASGAPADGAGVVVVGQRVEVARRSGAQDLRELGLGHAGELTRGGDADAVQPDGGCRADPPDPLDRERVEKCELVPGRDEEEPVGLGDGAGDLGEVLGAGDADGDGQPQALAGAAAKAGGDLPRCAGDPLHSADVEEGFVDREPLDGRGGVLEERVERTARLRVRGHSRADDDRVRAEPSGLASAHRRPDAVCLCLVAGGEHDAAADDHRTAAQAGVVALLDRREERVGIGMQDRRFGRHGHDGCRSNVCSL